MTLSDLEAGTALSGAGKSDQRGGDQRLVGFGRGDDRDAADGRDGERRRAAGVGGVHGAVQLLGAGDRLQRSDIETRSGPRACEDDQNNRSSASRRSGDLQTTDDRVFTTTVTPQTDRVAHSYTLRLTVPGGAVRSSAGNKPNEEPEEPLEVRVSPPGAPEPISTLSLGANGANGSVRLSWSRPSDNGGSPIIRYEYRYAATGEAWSEWEHGGSGVAWGDGGGT